MRIIKEGNIVKEVKCSYCNCEYEFETKDICDEYYSNIISSDYSYEERFVRKFVYCPECGEKYYIRQMSNHYSKLIAENVD